MLVLVVVIVVLVVVIVIAVVVVVVVVVYSNIGILLTSSFSWDIHYALCTPYLNKQNILLLSSCKLYIKTFTHGLFCSGRRV